MKAFTSTLALVVTTSALACSASSGPSGEAVGDTGGSSSNNGGASGTAPVLGGTGGTIQGGSGGTIPTSGSGGTAGEGQCGVQMFNLERKPAEVLLLLDRSASMKDPPEETTETQPKWDLIIPALLEVVEATGTTLSWGLKVFPEDGPDEGDPACSAGSVTDGIQVEIAENNTQAMLDAIRATDDGGDGTPTGDAMKQAVAYLQSRAGLNDYNRYVLLATDGEPSCVEVTATSAGREGQEDARPYAIQAITDSVGAGFPTFVVGVGTNKESAKIALNDMAVAGQRPAPCANPLDDCFYLGNSREQLKADLLSIATGISTCVFDLTAMPPDPDNTRVNLNGEKVPRDPSKMNGWDYQDEAQTIVEVYGPACDAVKASGAATIEILFGCPDIDVR